MRTGPNDGHQELSFLGEVAESGYQDNFRVTRRQGDEKRMLTNTQRRNGFNHSHVNRAAAKQRLERHRRITTESDRREGI
jgi:hypothetical protein